MTRNRKASRLLALLCSLAIVLTMVPAAVFADGDVAINDENFPDVAFRKYVKTFDTLDPKDDTLSAEELAAVTEMVVGYGIEDLTGIAHFTSLTTLNLFGSLVTTLDVSALTSLETLENAQLTSLTVDESEKHFTASSSGNGTFHIQGWTKTSGAAFAGKPDPGYYLFFVQEGAKRHDLLDPFQPEITATLKTVYTATFQPYLTGMTPGQSVTKGTVIQANLKTIERSGINTRWMPTQCRIGNLENSPVSIAENGDITIDTSSLAVGQNTLLAAYQKQTKVGEEWTNAEEEAITQEISFNVEEAPYVGPTYYYLTVENGSGDGAYTYGSKPAIEADVTADGKVFDKWVLTSGTGTIENEGESKTTFTMGFGSATVTATYKDEETPAQYQLTVENGSGSGTYGAGTQVPAKADKAAKGKVFDKWVLTEGEGTIADARSRETTFTMAESDAMIEAVYRKVAADPAEKPDKNGGSNGSNGSDDTGDQNAPKTGDDQMLFGWMAVLSAALAGICLINRRRETLDD